MPSVRDEGFSNRVNFSLVFLSGLVYYFGLDKQGAFTEDAEGIIQEVKKIKE